MPRASARELISVGTLIALMRPQIVFGMTRPLPPAWSSPRHLRPAQSFARSLPVLELADRQTRSGCEPIPAALSCERACERSRTYFRAWLDVVVTGLFIIAIAIPALLWLTWRRNADGARDDSHPSFRDWAVGEFDTLTGPVKGPNPTPALLLPIPHL